MGRNVNQDKKLSFGARVVRFTKVHPIIANLIAIIIVAIIIIWLLGSVFLWLWTRHDDTTSVPSVKGLSIENARSVLQREGYDVEIDSLYNDGVAPGSVIEQSPRENSVVKKGRTIYLTYACYTPKMARVPNYYNMSRRQAISAFREAGLDNVTVKEVPSEHSELVLGARYNGVVIHAGQEIPAGANVVLEVGASGPDGEYDVIEELVLPEDADAEFIESLDL